MNYYLISYDIIGAQGGDNHSALQSLKALITERLLGEILKHPVETSLVFSSSFEFEYVRQEVYNWSQVQKTFYVFSKIDEGLSGDLLCRLVGDPALEHK